MDGDPQPTSQERDRAAALNVDDVYRLAASLSPDERLWLVARLWTSLPAEHRAALVSLQFEDSHSPKEPDDFVAPYAPIEPIWPVVWQTLFDPSQTSGLYAAPRRFDLATIFVVTAAYSLMFGAMTALDASPGVKIMLGSLVTFVAAAQGLFRQVANPRGVSIVAGAVEHTLFSWILWATVPHSFPNSFLFVTLINGLMGGAIMGYLAGTMVGGVFLVADVLRGKFENRSRSESEDPPADGAG